MKISVILTCWRRFTNFDDIVRSWLAEPETSEVIIWDNSGKYKFEGETEKKVIVLNSSENLGSRVRYSLAAIAENEVVLFADDDVKIGQGFLNDLTSHYSYDKMVGVLGRQFIGKSYAEAFKHEVRADRIDEPTPVDFLVGFIMMMHRNHLLGMNFRRFPWTCCDLNLQGILKNNRSFLKKYVVPTTKYGHYDDNADENALGLMKCAREEKEQIYRQFFKGEEDAI